MDTSGEIQKYTQKTIINLPSNGILPFHIEMWMYKNRKAFNLIFIIDIAKVQKKNDLNISELILFMCDFTAVVKICINYQCGCDKLNMWFTIIELSIIL
jgi:hypothetical protein